MKSALSRFFCVIIVLIAPQKVFGWADLGHEIVGAVAEQTIQPSTEDFVRGILGVEPLAVAAVFPDHVRDDARFAHYESNPQKRDHDVHDFGGYHFCDIPTGFTYDTKPVKEIKDCYGVIQGAIRLLKDTSGKVSRAEKMIALRYLVHVMGDISQPLHVGNGFDKGGNTCQIAFQKDDHAPAVPVNLHTFWDDNMVAFLGTTYADPAAHVPAAKAMYQYMTALKVRRPEMLTADAKAKYSQGHLKMWIEEAGAIRESGLYPDPRGAMDKVAKGQEYKNRPYCNLPVGPVPANIQIPQIGVDYEKKFAPIVENQLLKAGLRLAATLDQIANDNSGPHRSTELMTTGEQESVLSKLQEGFSNH
jgi:hypothetical protein